MSPCAGRQAPTHCTTREGPHWGRICVSLGFLTEAPGRMVPQRMGGQGSCTELREALGVEVAGDGVSSAMKAWGGLGGSVCGGREGVRRGREASRPGDGATRPRLPLRGLCGWWLEGPSCRVRVGLMRHLLSPEQTLAEQGPEHQRLQPQLQGPQGVGAPRSLQAAAGMGAITWCPVSPPPSLPSGGSACPAGPRRSSAHLCRRGLAVWTPRPLACPHRRRFCPQQQLRDGLGHRVCDQRLHVRVCGHRGLLHHWLPRHRTLRRLLQHVSGPRVPRQLRGPPPPRSPPGLVSASLSFQEHPDAYQRVRPARRQRDAGELC